MTDKTTETKISEEVKTLAGVIKAGIEVNNDTGICKETVPHFQNYMETKGINKEQLDTIADGTTLFVAAGTKAFGEKAIELMAKNKTLNEASVSLSGGGLFESLTISTDRSRTYPTPNGGEPTVKTAVVTPVFTITSTKPVGELRKVKTHLNELGIKHNLAEIGNKALSE